ncbi:MAG: response regulator transcription factor [Alicyclobacillus herbarius]|uniref:response regulator n=1 Tax=Alicyclobacillus herbarius TaxID=122960 RepID=UPI00041C2F6F|nr:response regulator transcription factor [Alicyclobacillus herbarius]MCL6631469.1 response regulator transcription factor [Alicyclobacillus herbarius]
MGTAEHDAAIRVLIVDDHELFRQGVRAILDRAEDISVVGEAGDGQEAVEKCAALVPDIVLMDINMPVCNGLEATRLIKRQTPDVAILILTVSDAEETLFEAVKNGAAGYVLKNASPLEVLEAVRRVHAGEPVIPGNLAMRIITELNNPQPTNPSDGAEKLTEREIEVLRHLSVGASNRDIARALFISENTVRNHVRNILDKLHLNNRAQAAAYAVREGYTIHNPSENE